MGFFALTSNMDSATLVNAGSVLEHLYQSLNALPVLLLGSSSLLNSKILRYIGTMLLDYLRRLFVLSLSLPSLTATLSSAGTLDIQLPTGTFHGTSVPGSNVEKWLGIPFAQPPVGRLRFKAPVAITKRSSETRNATAFGNACPQVPDTNLGAPISEDCLFLNVRLSCW